MDDMQSDGDYIWPSVPALSLPDGAYMRISCGDEEIGIARAPSLTDNVVAFDRQNLNNIPAMLRHWADELESGRKEASSVLLVVPTPDGFPQVAGLGENLGDFDYIAILELAKAWFIEERRKGF